MHKQLLVLAVALTLAAGSAVASDKSLREKVKSAGLTAIPAGIPEVQNNPITREKIELGTMLFFDPRISASGVISCNTCHNLGTGGDDNLPTSVGHGWQKGPRNAPTVL